MRISSVWNFRRLIPALVGVHLLLVAGALVIPIPGDVVMLSMVLEDGCNSNLTSTRTLVDLRVGVACRMNTRGISQALADWSPDGEQVALAMGRGGSLFETELQLVNVDSGAQQRVTQRGGTILVRNPVWSPDGERVAYVGYTGTQGFLYVVEVGAEYAERVIPESLHASNPPAWSPDGDSLAYATVDDFARPTLCLLHLPSGDKRCLVQGEQPHWSPDGEHLAFVGDGQGVYLLDVQTGSTRRLSSRGGSPVWSPDGEHLAYVVQDGSPGAYAFEVQVHVVEPAVGIPRVVARDVSFSQFRPAWSNDSRRVFVIRADERTVQSVDVQTGATRTMTFAERVTGIAPRPE